MLQFIVHHGALSHSDITLNLFALNVNSAHVVHVHVQSGIFFAFYNWKQCEIWGLGYF